MTRTENNIWFWVGSWPPWTPIVWRNLSGFDDPLQMNLRGTTVIQTQIWALKSGITTSICTRTKNSSSHHVLPDVLCGAWYIWVFFIIVHVLLYRIYSHTACLGSDRWQRPTTNIFYTLHWLFLDICICVHILSVLLGVYLVLFLSSGAVCMTVCWHNDNEDFSHLGILVPLLLLVSFWLYLLWWKPLALICSGSVNTPSGPGPDQGLPELCCLHSWRPHWTQHP